VANPSNNAIMSVKLKPPGCGTSTPGMADGVEAITVDRYDAACALGNAVENWLHAMPVHAGRTNDPSSPAQSIVEIPLPRSADATHPHLDDALDPGHFTCTPHRARKRVAHAVSLFAPVEVCINLNNGDRSALRMLQKTESAPNRLHREALGRQIRLEWRR
jgi:hypothetical protein